MARRKPVGDLVLVRSRLLQLADRAHRREYPRELIHLGHGALQEEHRTLGIEAAGEEIDRELTRVSAKIRRALDRGHRVVVRDEVECLALILQPHGRLHRAEVIADVKFPAGLQPGQNAHGGEDGQDRRGWSRDVDAQSEETGPGWIG